MCKEQVRIRKETVTAHVMRICWHSTVDKKQAKKKKKKKKKTKTSAEVFSDAEGIRSHDICRKTLRKTSNVFNVKEIRECNPSIVKHTKLTIKEIILEIPG